MGVYRERARQETESRGGRGITCAKNTVVPLHQSRVLEEVTPCRLELGVDDILRDPTTTHKGELVVHKTSVVASDKRARCDGDSHKHGSGSRHGA
jgi:hypothetical protein